MQVARHLLGHVQFANLMAGLADRLGAFRRGQQQARQGALDVLAAGAGAADAAAVLDLPDATGRPLAERGGQAPAQFAAAVATVREQPVARGELVLQVAQGEYSLLGRVAVVLAAGEVQQAVDAGAVEGAFLVFAEHHGEHRAVVAGELAGQSEEVLVVAGETAADHVRDHRDEECRLLDHMQRQLRFLRYAGAARAAALLAAGAIDAADAVGAEEADGVRVLADHAVGAHPAHLAALGGLHGRMQRMQAVAGDPFGAWIATDDIVHAECFLWLRLPDPAAPSLEGEAAIRAAPVSSGFDVKLDTLINAPPPRLHAATAFLPALPPVLSALPLPARRCP